MLRCVTLLTLLRRRRYFSLRNIGIFKLPATQPYIPRDQNPYMKHNQMIEIHRILCNAKVHFYVYNLSLFWPRRLNPQHFQSVLGVAYTRFALLRGLFPTKTLYAFEFCTNRAFPLPIPSSSLSTFLEPPCCFLRFFTVHFIPCNTAVII